MRAHLPKGLVAHVAAVLARSALTRPQMAARFGMSRRSVDVLLREIGRSYAVRREPGEDGVTYRVVAGEEAAS